MNTETVEPKERVNPAKELTPPWAKFRIDMLTPFPCPRCQRSGNGQPGTRMC